MDMSDWIGMFRERPLGPAAVSKDQDKATGDSALASDFHMEVDLLLGRTLILVAHPDDEAIGCGALLARMASSVVVFATDGAPSDAFFWREYGSRAAYAQIRRQEALRVATFAGVGAVRFLGVCGFVDQELVRKLPTALDDLRKIVTSTGVEMLLAPAYEGGHPDHDCCNFMAAAVAGEFQLSAWEMPLYHRSPDGEIKRQQFLAKENGELIYNLSPAEQTRKRAMLDLYCSQRVVLQQFNVAQERFRWLPAYDYGRPPHEGILNYEAWGWEMSGREVAAAFRSCLEQIKEDRVARIR